MERENDGVNTMLGLVRSLPDQLEASYAEAGGRLGERRFPPRVFVFGMGGSAAAAQILSDCYREVGVDLRVVRDYGPVGRIDANTLLVFSSYSGNTEETLSAYETAASRFPDAPRVLVGSGGRLAEWGERDGHLHLRVPGGLPPRASLGHGVGLLTALVERCEGVGSQAATVVSVLARLREVVQGGDDASIALARRLARRLPVIYSSRGPTRAAAMRWRAQCNENAKCLVATAELPELDHNEVVGWEVETPARSAAVVVALRDPREHPRTRRRFEVTRRVLGDRVAGWVDLEAVDGPSLQRAMDLVAQGDLLSVRLAAEHGVDPMPVRVIDELKTSL